jgi:lipoate-protein ligase A
MARDEALLLCSGWGLARHAPTPVLRFYNWNPACVSLGRLQKPDSAFRIQHSAFDMVRRPTGGRAVLHQHEITYCAVIHESHLPRESRSVIGAYEWLSAGFIEGLKTLGVDARLSSAQRRGAARCAPTNCFNAAAQCDFLVDGRKLIGAAQCRKDGAILQHGAILLEIDRDAWASAVGGAMSDAVALRDLGVLSSRDEIIEALCDGMSRAWDISFEQSALSVEELQVARRLHEHKYSASEWNECGRLPA